MPMPKTAMYKNRFLPTYKGEIRATLQGSGVEPVPIPHTVNQFSDNHLWLGIFRAHPPHDFAAERGGKYIHLNTLFRNLIYVYGKFRDRMWAFRDYRIQRQC